MATELRRRVATVGVIAIAGLWLGCSSDFGVIEPDSGPIADIGVIDVRDAVVDTTVSVSMDASIDGGDSGMSVTDIVTSGSDIWVFDGPPVPVDGAVCGDTHIDVHIVPSNVLILLDRSCSMKNSPTNTVVTEASGLSKWSLAVQAIHTMTATYASQVRWGLIYLPRSGTMAQGVSCTGTAVCGGTTSCPEVTPAASTGTMIDTVLASGISPYIGCGHGTQVAITPLNQGLLASGMVTQLHDAARSDFVMLITDGEETCVGQPMVVATVTALRAEGIHTAVVGFGAAGAGGVNAVELNAMAVAGGIPASGATSYYAANDGASLISALTQIVGATISCTFPLGAAPSDLSLLEVFANVSTVLPRDPRHASGWDYDPATRSITLYGSACADVRSLMYSQLDVIQVCPGGAPPPPPPACHHLGQNCTSNQDCCNLEGLACDTLHDVCVGSPE